LKRRRGKWNIVGSTRVSGGKVRRKNKEEEIMASRKRSWGTQIWEGGTKTVRFRKRSFSVGAGVRRGKTYPKKSTSLCLATQKYLGTRGWRGGRLMSLTLVPKKQLRSRRCRFLGRRKKMKSSVDLGPTTVCAHGEKGGGKGP